MKKISIMSEEFKNEKTGETVEGITIMVDGVLKQFFDIIKIQKPEYQDNISIIQNMLIIGLEGMKNNISS